jgi:hypothetical protein
MSLGAPVSWLVVTNDVSLSVSPQEQLTVAQLRQFLGSADRVGLPDDTIVICTAISPNGHIGGLATQARFQNPAAGEGK